MEETMQQILKKLQLIDQIVSQLDDMKKYLNEFKQGQEKMKIQLDRIEKKLN
jgi:hypothetical protein